MNTPDVFMNRLFWVITKTCAWFLVNQVIASTDFGKDLLFQVNF